MVVEYIRYTIDAARAEAFQQAYRRAAEALEASKHCERYAAAADIRRRDLLGGLIHEYEAA